MNHCTNSSSTSFKITYALLNDVLVHIDDAKKVEGSEKYTCPGCHSVVIVRSGRVRLKHYAHQSGSRCSPETVIHKTAKLKVRELLKRKCQQRFIVECERCNKDSVYSLPANLENVEVEKKIGPYIADVLAWSENFKFAFEIFVTHSIDVEKSKNYPCSFVELSGQEVIDADANRNDEYIWRPTQHLGISKNTCEKCSYLERNLKMIAKLLDESNKRIAIISDCTICTGKAVKWTDINSIRKKSLHPDSDFCLDLNGKLYPIVFTEAKTVSGRNQKNYNQNFIKVKVDYILSDPIYYQLNLSAGMFGRCLNCLSNDF